MLSGVLIGEGVSFRLPGLVHLTLSNCKLAAAEDDACQLALRPDSLPNLIDLAIISDRVKVTNQVRADRHAAVAALAPQLHQLTLCEYAAWIDPSDFAFWSTCQNLVWLVITEPKTANDAIGVLVPAALEHLPGPLTVLDIVTYGRTFTATARDVLAALDAGCTSVATLRQLELPTAGQFRAAEGLTNWVQELALEKLVRVAQKRGIEVIQ